MARTLTCRCSLADHGWEVLPLNQAGSVLLSN